MTEAQAYAVKWMDLQVKMASLVKRAAISRTCQKAKRYLESAQSVHDEMAEIERAITVHLALEPHQRIKVAPGCYIGINSDGEIGIEGVNKPETFGEIFS